MRWPAVQRSSIPLENSQLHDLVATGDHDRFGAREFEPIGRCIGVGDVVRVDAERLAEPRPVEQVAELDQTLVGVHQRVAGEARVDCR